jgi:hypothetical protein
MGESKRRKVPVFNLGETPLPNDGSLKSIMGSALANVARMLNAVICLKEPNDGLLESWPLGTIVGQTPWPEKARECPARFDLKLAPSGAWEFLITDKFVVSVYCIDAHKRGVLWPGPVHPDQFMDRVREFFRTSNASGWVTVVPNGWGEAMSRREGAPQ